MFVLWLAAGSLALVGVSVVAVNLFGDDGRADPPSSGTPANPCAAEVAAAEGEVSAARVAAGHWREHVQARTALLAGRISKATTKAIWKRTRLAGPADLQRLTAATTTQQRLRGGCANAPGAAGRACRQRLTVLAAAAAAGQVTAHEWQAHLAMMAAHKAGEMDNEHAQTMWVAAWRAAPANLTAFAHADATLARTTPCHRG